MPPKTLSEQCSERKALRVRRIQILKARGAGAQVRQRLIRSYYMAVRNSKQRGIEFSLSTHDLLRLANRANGHCEVTGIKFDVIETSRKWDRQPWTASIDRIDCSKGYTFGNCRLVCAAVNVALNSWGVTVLERIAEAMTERKLRQHLGYMDQLRKFHVKHRRRIRHLKSVA